jgi:3-oxoacyl-[acyl-carrier protein] reductase
MSDLTGKNALVTGSSSGIGASIAKRMASSGAAVAVNYYPGCQDAAAQVVAQIEAAGGRAVAVEGDVSDPSSATWIVESSIAELGGLDIVVNNAGITRDGLVVRMGDDEWNAVISTNLSGVFYVSRACAKHFMKQRSGTIVNVASVIGLVGNAGQANYASAKAGVIALTKSLAKELAPRGVRANAVAPGFIETDMTAKLPENVREAARNEIALKRFGSADDVAKAILFLASDDSAYITGQVLAIDGGMTFC